GHLMTEKRQRLLQVFTHDGLIVGHDHAQATVHEHPRGRVSRISAPCCSAGPTSILPPWASTIRLAMAMPRPLPWVRVVKKASKILRRSSQVNGGPLLRRATRSAGRSPSVAS